MNNTLSLVFHINPGAEADAEEAAELGRQLRQELLQIDEVERAEFPEKTIPKGAMAGGAVDWMQLLLALMAAGGVMTTTLTVLGSTVQAWINRQKDPKPNITVEFPNGVKIALTGASQEEVNKLTAQAMDYQRGFTPR